MPGDKGGRVRLSDDAFCVCCVFVCVHVCACTRVVTHMYSICLSHVFCSQINRGHSCWHTWVWLCAAPLLPSCSSPRVSSEITALSCGTRLISSVIKINEVLIAAVIYANDCGIQDEDFSSLLQWEARSGIWCVQAITSRQSSASNVADVIFCLDDGDSGGGSCGKSLAQRVLCVPYWTSDLLVSL